MSTNVHAKAYAKRERAKLIALLGGRCVKCGSTELLEFDHEHGRTWDPTRTSQWRRMTRYREEAAAGLIRLLCRSCNASDGQRFRKVVVL